MILAALVAVERAQATREADLRAVVAQRSLQLEEACRQRSAAGRLAERRTWRENRRREQARLRRDP